MGGQAVRRAAVASVARLRIRVLRAHRAQARGLLMLARMQLAEFDRSAAYIAAKSALDVVQRVTGGWPSEVAQSAKRCATDMVAAIAESLEHAETSSARRRCLRGALCNALELAAICDVARAHGLGCDESLRCAGRTLSMLGLSYHATSIANE